MGGLGRVEVILWRSAFCIIHSCGASNAITSWRGTSGLGFASIVSCKRFIRLLLGDSDFGGGASPKAAINEEAAQVLECRAIYLRRAERRISAGRLIQHPARHHDDHAGARFDEAQPRAVPDLAVMQP